MNWVGDLKNPFQTLAILLRLKIVNSQHSLNDKILIPLLEVCKY